MNCLGLDIRLRMDAEPPGNKQPLLTKCLKKELRLVVKTRGETAAVRQM